MKSRKGLTLAEMLIVMAITVVFAATAIHVTGDSLEAARNSDRETRISAAVYDAYLYALKTGGTLVAAPMPDTVLDDMKAYVKSGALSVSFGAKTVTVTAVPMDADKIESEFAKDMTGTFQLSRVIFYAGDTEFSSIPAT